MNIHKMNYNKYAKLGEGAIISASYSKNGKYCALATAKGVALHDGNDFTRKRFFKFDDKPMKVLLSDDNKYIALGTEKTYVMLIDIESDAIIKLSLGDRESIYEDFPASDFKEHTAYSSWLSAKNNVDISSLSFSADSRFLAVAYFPLYGIQKYISASKEEVEIIKKSDLKKSTVIWDIETKKIKYSLISSHLSIFGVDFSQDGKYLAICGVGPTCVWKLTDPPIPQIVGHTDFSITGGYFFPDGKNIGLLGTMSYSVSEIDTRQLIEEKEFGTDDLPFWVKYLFSKRSESRAKIKKFSGYTFPIKSLAISNDNKYLASGGEDSNIYIWDIQKFSVHKTLCFSTEYSDSYPPISDLDFSPDNKYLLTTGQPDGICIWDINSGTVKERFFKNGHGRFSNDGNLLALIDCCGPHTTNSIFSIKESESVLICEFPTHEIINNACLCFSPDNRFIAIGGKDGILEIRAVETKELLLKEQFTQNEPFSYFDTIKKTIPARIEFLHFLDNQNIILRTVGRYKTLDIQTREIKNLHKIQSRRSFCPEQNLSVSAKNKILAHSNGSNIELWNIESESLVATIPEKYTEGKIVSLSSDGSLLATACYEGIIDVWKLNSTNES